MRRVLIISVVFFALSAYNVVFAPTVLQAQHIVLYGTEIDSDTLFTIDITNGVATVVGALVPAAQIEGLAFNPDSGNFFGTDNSNHTLVEFSTDALSWSVAQSLPYGTYSNLARNPITGIYYTYFNNTDTLSTVDPVNGAVVPVGPSSGVYMQSLAFDSSGRLFGIGDIPAPGQEALYELDVSTGAILSITEITSDLINPRFDNSLAIHPETGVFYTVAAIEGGFYEVNPLTGVANRIGNTGLRNIRSLDFAVVNEETIIIDGCDSGVENLLFDTGYTMSNLIAECANIAENHGEFVSCVSHLTNDWKIEGLISGQEKGAIQSCAAEASIP